MRLDIFFFSRHLLLSFFLKEKKIQVFFTVHLSSFSIRLLASLREIRKNTLLVLFRRVLKNIRISLGETGGSLRRKSPGEDTYILNTLVGW